MFRRSTCLLALSVAFLAGCGNEATELEDQLTQEDSQFLADLIDATAMSMFDDVFGSTNDGPSGAPSLTHAPVVWTRTFARSRSCHDGGTLTIAGTGPTAWDGEAVTYDVESSGTKTRVDCAHTREDVVITLNGNAAWTHERHHLDHAPTGTWITTYIGGWDWAKSTGESGSCFYDLTVTIVTAENTWTMTGTFCGDEIDRSRTWRDG